MAEEDPSVTIAQLQDRIKKLEEDNRRWMRLAGTNRLTNLPNSLMLYRIVLPTELRKYDGREVSLACLLIAPDGLGEINQAHGRAVGDELIKEIAGLLKQKIGQNEQLFHPDGANFFILMMGATEGRAKRKAMEIKSEFGQVTLTATGKEFEDLTYSVGVVVIDGIVRKDAIQEAMDQLYQDLSDGLHEAKQRGGNTVVGVEKRSVGGEKK